MPSEPAERKSAIRLSVPELRGREWAYLKECLDSTWVSSVGPFVDRFERDVATYVGARHGIATVNGTAALHVALLVAGVRRDDEVLVPALTFIAPANAVRYVGAWPVFVDAEPDYFQMDPAGVEQFLVEGCEQRGGAVVNRASGRRVAAVVVVHLLGHPVNMGPILDVTRRYGLPVIEDATESIGARYQGEMVGHLGDIACFSFNGNKTITTGGGGMILTDRDEWAGRAKYLTTQAKDDPVEYVHGAIGFNYRLTNIQAALGCAQLEMLPDFLEEKRRIAQRYGEALRDTGLRTMSQAPWAHSTFWLYTIRFSGGRQASRGAMRFLADRSIQARPLWQPLHLSPAHAESQPRSCPIAEALSAESLSLPSSVGLTMEQQERVVDEVRAWLSHAMGTADVGGS